MMRRCTLQEGRGWSAIRRVAAATLIAVSSACASGRTQPVVAPVADHQSVTLQPGDKVRVEIWREQDLSGEFTVHEDGTVTLPLLGDQKVTHIPLGELRDSLLLLYRKELRNPSIEIVPLRNVLVLGAVENPGPYEANPISTVLGVIALAGGVNSGGTLDHIEIRRDNVLLLDRVPPGASLSSLNLRSGDQIVVGHRPWITRNQAFLVSVILAIPSVVYTITRIGN